VEELSEAKAVRDETAGTGPVRIIAVGNRHCGDDGIGAAVLECIREKRLFPRAELIDAQTDSLSLIERFTAAGCHIIIDAARMGLRPGGTALIRPEDISRKIRSDRLSLHGFGLAETLELARRIDKAPGRLMIIGVEPERVEFNCGLSGCVAAAVPGILDLIQAEVQRYESNDSDY
jgi:hydrogenase maturation protease